MFSLRLTFLTGRYVASSSGHPSWPPEPDRVFNALTAAWGRTGESEAGRKALEWLEGLGPPMISASPKRDGAKPVHYVPQNNFNPGRKVELLPELRAKIERRILSVIPEEPEVAFMWPDADPPEDVALTRLCADVSYVGHSSSLVRLEAGSFEKPVTFEPTDKLTDLALRVPQRGRLEFLRQFHERGQRPEPLGIEMVHYANIAELQEPVSAQTAFGDWEILRFHGNLPFEPFGAESLVSSLRRVILSRAAKLNGSSQPVSPAISGHGPDGKPTRDPHIAFVPLLDVGHPYSDGHIRGLAMVRPVTLSKSPSGKFMKEHNSG